MISSTLNRRVAEKENIEAEKVSGKRVDNIG